MIDQACIKQNQSRMATQRSSHDSVWAEIAGLCYPDLKNFMGGQVAQSKFMREQANSTSRHDPETVIQVERAVALFLSYVMPRGQRWQKLELADEALMAKVANQQWLELLERRLFGLRNMPENGFVTATNDSVWSLYTFGPQSMWVDDRWDTNTGRWAGIRYEAEFVGDVWIERDSTGLPLRIHRRLVLTAEAAMAKWKDKSPRCVKEAMAKDGGKNRQAEFEFLHIIEPNREYDPSRIDAKGKPWAGAYYAVNDDEVFDEGGYRSLPRLVSAYARRGGVNYGRSPAMVALPKIREVVEMDRDADWAAELSLLPPILTGDALGDNGVLELSALGVTEGGLDDRGNPLARPLQIEGDTTHADNRIAQKRAVIAQIFQTDIMQLNREYKSHISAARTEEEKAEKGVLLSPLALQETEWLSPMTTRELSIMGERGMMDDMPEEIMEYLQSAGTMGIRYNNGLTALQEAGKSAAFLSLAQQVGAVAAFDPSYIQRFNREYPPERVIPELGRIAGVPAAMRATEDERAAFDAEQARQQQLQQILQAVPALAGAAKDVASASMPQGGMPVPGMPG